MKPYYQDEWVQIFHGDCREILPTLPKVDLVLTDPPYEIELPTSHRKKYNGLSESFAPIENDTKGFCLEWFEKIKSLTKDYIIFGGNNFIEFIPARYGWIVWDKRLNEMADRILGSPFELAITSKMSQYKIYRIQHGGKINADSIWGNNDARYHPTQKPVALFLRILADNPCDSIIDPFLGSGTTLLAAKKLNRHAIGIEIEERYCEIAARRCSQGVMTLNILPEVKRTTSVFGPDVDYCGNYIYDTPAETVKERERLI